MKKQRKDTMKKILASVCPAVAACVLCGCPNSRTDRFQENPVPAIGQNAEDVRSFDPGKGPRILFVGNSITLHGPRPEIGWTNNWGMAASAAEKDYVHLVRDAVRARYPDAQRCLMQVADTFERSFFKDGWSCEANWSWAKEFRPDAAILFFGANVPQDYDAGTLEPAPARSFADALEALCGYLDSGSTAFFVSQGFYIRPALDAEKEAVCGRGTGKYVDISAIRERADVHGMYNHPNDLGMELIAGRFAGELLRELDSRKSAE